MFMKILFVAVFVLAKANCQNYAKLVCNETCICKPIDDDKISWKIDCSNSALNTTWITPYDDTKRYTEISFENSKLTSLKRDHISSVHPEHVEKYNFANNLINDIENHTFDRVLNLKVIDLSKNKLTTVEKEWFNGLWDSLTNLDMSYNNIGNIPDGAFPLSILKYLNLDGNPIAKIGDQTFSKLSFLLELSLDNTAITEISDSAFSQDNLPRLETLSIRKSFLEHLPTLELKYLKKVEFDQNDLIVAVHKDTFAGVPTLEEILMDSMAKLKTIEDCAFCGLPNLKFVRISDSPQLTSIPETAFDVGYGYAPSLQTVDFGNNSLTTLSPKLLPWKSVSSLWLAGNKWNCSCELAWMSNVSASFKDVPRCYSPTRLQNSPINTLNKTAFGVCRRNVYYRTPKIFIAMTIMLLLSGIVLIMWYIWSSRKQDRGIGHIFKTNPLVKQPYAYRNLAMRQEDNEQIVANKFVVDPDEEDDSPYPPFDKNHGNKANLV